MGSVSVYLSVMYTSWCEGLRVVLVVLGSVATQVAGDQQSAIEIFIPRRVDG